MMKENGEALIYKSMEEATGAEAWWMEQEQ